MTKLEYQLDILKLEIETINGTIRQMDVMTEKIKNWAIVIWAAATGASITTASLNRYIALTAAVPLAFWLVDGWYRRIQSRFIWRSDQINAFLNDKRLSDSFANQEITDFVLFDPASRRSKKDPGFKAAVSMKRILRFGSLSLLYLFLSAMSLLAWLVSRVS